MSVKFDRKVFFDDIRHALFGGKLTQQQVDGMSFKLQQWEAHPYHPTDLRWLSYPFATSMHETASTMWPIAEYGKGEGHAYGKPHPTTGQVYYGRGDVQLTWHENYKRADRELGLQGSPDSLEAKADNALDPKISADVMFMGMREGWFRKRDGKPETLHRYFSPDKDDPFNAREIINGDKNRKPNWANGKTIGQLIAGYHKEFFEALTMAAVWDLPEIPDIPPVEPPLLQPVTIAVVVPEGQSFLITVNGVIYATTAGEQS